MDWRSASQPSLGMFSVEVEKPSVWGGAVLHVALSNTVEVPKPTGLAHLLLVPMLGQSQHPMPPSRTVCVRTRGQDKAPLKNE